MIEEKRIRDQVGLMRCADENGQCIGIALTVYDNWQEGQYARTIIEWDELNEFMLILLRFEEKFKEVEAGPEKPERLAIRASDDWGILFDEKVREVQWIERCFWWMTIMLVVCLLTWNLSQ